MLSWGEFGELEVLGLRLWKAGGHDAGTIKFSKTSTFAQSYSQLVLTLAHKIMLPICFL